MSAVCLKAKSSLKTEIWSSIFTSMNTDTKSFLFIKQLTSTCVSTILYLRKVLSEEYFESTTFEGMTLKLLKSGKRESYASKIENWLEGAFDAVEKKYLKRLMLDIQDAESDMTLEIYTMTFNYSKEKEVLNPFYLTNTLNNDNAMTISETKLNTIRLLQMCHAVTQSYSNLPSQIKLSMRLSYHENTPEDYQPRGYVAWELEDPKFPKQARSIEIGITSTETHFFKLYNKSCLSDKFFKDIENSSSTKTYEEIEDTQLLENTVMERATKAKRELQFDNAKNHTENFPTLSENKAETFFRVTEKSENKIEKYKPSKRGSRKKSVVKCQNVRCACLSSIETETMFPCLGCKFMVHSECYGVLQFDPTKKVRFYCHLCHQAENNFKCHDKVLLNLKNSSDQQKLSILRRVLRYCNSPKVYKITLKIIEKIVGTTCSQNVPKIVLNKLIEIGVLIVQGKKKNYLIDKKVLTNKLVFYFYKVQSTSQSQSQILLRPSENFVRKNTFDEISFNKKNNYSNAVLQDILTSNNSQTSQQSCDIFC